MERVGASKRVKYGLVRCKQVVELAHRPLLHCLDPRLARLPAIVFGLRVRTPVGARLDPGQWRETREPPRLLIDPRCGVVIGVHAPRQ
jgi:hypothetical protein